MADQGKTTTSVNFRSGPGTQHASFGVLSPGTPLTILEDTGDWLRVDVTGRKGFIKRPTRAICRVICWLKNCWKSWPDPGAVE